MTIELTSLVDWNNNYEEYIQCIDPIHGKLKVLKEYKFVSAFDYSVIIYVSFANLQHEIAVGCWSAFDKYFV